MKRRSVNLLHDAATRNGGDRGMSRAEPVTGDHSRHCQGYCQQAEEKGAPAEQVPLHAKLMAFQHFDGHATRRRRIGPKSRSLLTKKDNVA